MQDAMNQREPIAGAPSPSGAGAGSMPFGRSTSQAQGYHQPQSQHSPAAEQPEMQFRRSQSEPQAIVQAEKTKGVGWRLKNAFFKSENAISTWMTLGFIKAWTDKTMGAWGVSSPLAKLSEPGSAVANLKGKMPTIPGMDKITALAYGKDFDKSALVSSANRKPESKWEKAMAVGITGALVQNLAFFMTTRGGEIPEGKNMMQRLWNSLKHPDKHSVHFSNATMSGFIGLIGVSRVVMGIKGMRTNAPDAIKKNTMMLVSGLSALVSAPLVFTGLFQIDRNQSSAPDAQAESEKNQAKQQRDEQVFSKDKSDTPEAGAKGKGLVASLKPGHMKEMWEYAFKHDRKGLLGRALAVTMELGFMMDGRRQLSEDPTSQSAYKTVKGGMTGLMLTCMQTHFVYDRLLSNSKKEAGVTR